MIDLNISRRALYYEILVKIDTNIFPSFGMILAHQSLCFSAFYRNLGK